MNPLYQAINKPQMNKPNMMQAFNQFRQSFSGDPKQAVQNLLNSGRMSQPQFNQLQQMATEFMNAVR